MSKSDQIFILIEEEKKDEQNLKDAVSRKSRNYTRANKAHPAPTNHGHSPLPLVQNFPPNPEQYHHLYPTSTSSTSLEPHI